MLSALEAHSIRRHGYFDEIVIAPKSKEGFEQAQKAWRTAAEQYVVPEQRLVQLREEHMKEMQARRDELMKRIEEQRKAAMERHEAAMQRVRAAHTVNDPQDI